ncbi:hypothetical protein GQ44DRAFT_698214 [Phaeosphaeriaceae sp. PMI808]|nr:hypothetical protein GQ44DRAFT_698214 [Phaeosphaeriaceae sp. PMI808]
MSFLRSGSTHRNGAQYAYPPSTFERGVVAESLKLIEVTGDGVSRRLEVTKELIEAYIEQDFGRMLENNSIANAVSIPQHETIKLFRSIRIGDYDGDMVPISVTKEFFTRIAPFARIPTIYPQILVNKTATCILATPQLPHEMSKHISHSTVRNEYLSFIFQSIPGAINHVCIGASFTYHFPSKQVYLFIHGLAHMNYDRFLYSIENGAVAESAFLIPSLIVQFNLEERLKALNLWQDKIYWNERKLGIRFDHHDNPDPTSVDYNTLSKDLNAANTNLAYVSWSCKNTIRQLDFMDEVANLYRSKAVRNGTSYEQAAEVEKMLLEAHAHLRSWNHGLNDRAEYLSKRSQALVQTVYSGIAQRDSSISLGLAGTSTKLAESSQEIALSTSRDSAVMRVIAAITIFFLPATFTATFFSTTFFSFNSSLDGRVYSKWLWLYFVVTFLLTATTVVGTWLLWKGKEKEISDRAERRHILERQRHTKQQPLQQPHGLISATQNYIQQAIGTVRG